MAENNGMVLSRVKSAVSGDEYYIGTYGDNETLVVTLQIGGGSVTWSDYKVTVEDKTAGTAESKNLSETGTVNFSIPWEHQYVVTLPTVSGYPVPLQRTYYALKVLSARYLDYIYENNVEQVNIHAIFVSTNSDVSLITGKTLTAKITGSSTTYSTTFDSEGDAVLNIPYGLTYILEYPEVDGLYVDIAGRTYTSGVVSRNIIIQYSDILIGVFGISSEGKYYNIDSIRNGLDDGTISASDIVAVGVSSPELIRAKRGDGSTYNCSFCYNIADTAVGRMWADSNISFNPNKLPYITSIGAANISQIDGNYNTAKIIEVSANRECGTWTYNSDTKRYDGTNLTSVGCPAATYCYEKSLTINGVTRNGFLPSFYQIYVAKNNLSALQELYTLLGKTFPNIASGNWWTSCQYSETNSVYLNFGGFYGGYFKTDSGSVLPVYDL